MTTEVSVGTDHRATAARCCAVTPAKNATDDGTSTRVMVQPKANDACGPNARRRIAVSPPRSGSAAPGSASAKAPRRDSAAPATQSPSARSRRCTARATREGVAKIPLPTIAPTVTSVASKAPSTRRSLGGVPPVVIGWSSSG
jgi:hypothetical protein